MPPLSPLSLPAAALFAALLAALTAACGIFLVRGSTAVPAGCWAVAACLALAAEMGARVAGGLGEPAVAAAARLAVVAVSLCPAMSLLGAKRPQHGVWQLIVATLAVVLCLPAASALLMRPGSLPDLHLLERCFVPVLIVVGWVNFAGTRRAVAAGSVAVGQLLLARGLLPGTTQEPSLHAEAAARIDAIATALVLAGTLLAALQAVAGRGGRARGIAGGDGAARGGMPELADAVSTPFLALRETLGAAWTLRIAERFDTAAVAHGWPCRLRFGGLEMIDGLDSAAAVSNGWQRDARRAFRALMRRFVSDAWLTRHRWPGGDV